jgi:hypothetical protein
MSRIGRYANPATTLDFAPDGLPPGTAIEALAFSTSDRSATTGLLFRPTAGDGALVTLMHPRVDFTRHYLIPPLLRAGHAVWAQRSRTVNNDVTTVHEQLLLDIAAAHVELERRGFERVYMLGNSGGASLYAFYLQQAALPSDKRLTDAPSGLRVDLTSSMPMPHGLILLAPHRGQGDLLLDCIDPAVADETDPGSVIPELDLFNPANGFREPPKSSSYTEDFVKNYRAAQRSRVLRIDAHMRELLAEQREWRQQWRDGNDGARRRALAGRFVTVHRTDADPRTVDLSLDPSERDYGSVIGRRPDVTNYGPVGFARLTTPHAWLSTWSGISTRAALRLTLPDVVLPTLLVTYRADNSVFPEDVEAIERAAGGEVMRIELDGDHHGFSPGTEERQPNAANAICEWLAARI